MTPAESARIAEAVWAAVADLRATPEERLADSDGLAKRLVADGLPEADAAWLAAAWTRKRRELADALADAVVAAFGLSAAAREIEERHDGPSKSTDGNRQQ